MEKCIETTKTLIYTQVKTGYISQASDFLRYNKTYPWTNEKINAYLKLMDFNGKSTGLSVLASGDQPFNLIMHGMSTIDTFDINPLTEYYALGLKRAMILKYDYKTFNKIRNILFSQSSSTEEITEIIKSLFPYMEKEHRIFWKTIIDYNYTLQKNENTKLNLILMLLLTFRFDPEDLNDYLKSAENYQLLRMRLGNANITFRNVNALNLAREYNGNQYDVIMLSNILDYFHTYMGVSWNYQQLKEYEGELEKIARHNATIFLHYVICYKMNNVMFRKALINKSTIVPIDLTDEELVTLPSGTSIDHGIVLKRANNCKRNRIVIS